MSVILTNSEWNNIPADQKRIYKGTPQVKTRHIEQGRWSYRWSMAGIFPDEQIRSLSLIEQTSAQ